MRPNQAALVELALAAAQCGPYLTPVNHHLTAPEIAYVLEDSGAHVLVASERFGDACRAAPPDCIGAKMAPMPTIQIKHVPEDVHAELRRRAAASGRSLQEYLLARLVEQARQPALEEVLDRAGGRSGGSISFDFAAGVVRSDRDRG